MFFALIVLLAGLALASVAAAFAIFGIVAVFSGAPTSALIMGAAIELGKVVGVSWIYRNWQEKTMLKWVMVPIVIVSMALTSLGIFGYLSKAHLDQNAPVANHSLQIERLDNRISAEQAKITDAESVIAQLDDTVQTLIRFEKISGADGARAVRASQQEQRDALATIVSDAQRAIDEYSDQKLVLSQELRSVELEVGPIRYVAELIYEDAESQLENAVRLLIIAFIFVFDPMAILLLMAGNFSMMKRYNERHPKTGPPKVEEPTDEVDVMRMEDYLVAERARRQEAEAVVEEPQVEEPALQQTTPAPQPESRRTIKMRDLQRSKLEKIDGSRADVTLDTDQRARSFSSTFGYQFDTPDKK